MLLTIEQGRLSADGKPIDPNRHYDLDGVHQFIVHAVYGGYIVKIKAGSQSVQSARVRILNMTAGTAPNGDAPDQPYRLKLNPKKPIFPIVDLVDQLLRLGCEAYQISPMFEPELSHSELTAADPHMLSDVEVTRTDLPPSGVLKPQSTFVVNNAEWAVAYYADESGNDIVRIFLWMNAIGVAYNVIAAIQQINDGTAEPKYV
ncbi:MAG TPA: hypothetical protein VLG40_02020 [Candidatus Saccharimonas sp.]|nr:hypothetical protein [Candidatus Saccharimonas sp.]